MYSQYYTAVQSDISIIANRASASLNNKPKLSACSCTIPVATCSSYSYYQTICSQSWQLSNQRRWPGYTNKGLSQGNSLQNCCFSEMPDYGRNSCVGMQLSESVHILASGYDEMRTTLSSHTPSRL